LRGHSIYQVRLVFVIGRQPNLKRRLVYARPPNFRYPLLSFRADEAEYVYFDVVRNKPQIRIKYDDATLIRTICGIGDSKRHLALDNFSKRIELVFKVQPPEWNYASDSLLALFEEYNSVLAPMKEAAAADPEIDSTDKNVLGAAAMGILSQHYFDANVHHKTFKGLITPNNSDSAVNLFIHTKWGGREKWVLAVFALHPDEAPMPVGRRPAILKCHETDVAFRGTRECETYTGPGGHSTCIVIKDNGGQLTWNYYNPDDKGMAADNSSNSARYQAIGAMLSAVPLYAGIVHDKDAQERFPLNAGIQRFVRGQYNGYCAFFTKVFMHETVVNGDLHGTHVLNLLRVALQCTLYADWNGSDSRKYHLIDLARVSDEELITAISEIRWASNMQYKDYFELFKRVCGRDIFFSYSIEGHMKRAFRENVIRCVTAFLTTDEESIDADDGKEFLIRLDYIKDGDELNSAQKAEVLDKFRRHHGSESNFANEVARMQEAYSLCYVDKYNEIMGTIEDSMERHSTYGKESVDQWFSKEVFTSATPASELGEFESFSSSKDGTLDLFSIALQERLAEAEADPNSIYSHLGAEKQLWPTLLERVNQLLDETKSEVSRIEDDKLHPKESRLPFLTHRIESAIRRLHAEFIDAGGTVEERKAAYDELDSKIDYVFASKDTRTRRRLNNFKPDIINLFHAPDEDEDEDEDEGGAAAPGTMHLVI